LNGLLTTLARQGVISPLSLHFAEFIADKCNISHDSLLALSAALLSENNQQGDVCLQMDRYLDEALFHCESIPDQAFRVDKTLAEWRDYLLQSGCVAEAGQVAPLILDNNRLYLHRYWLYETEVAQAILRRLQNADTDLDIEALKRQLGRLYGDALDDQKLAVALCVSRRFAVISGGPGTGKTTTLINILSVLLAQQADMRIALAAPTGKAAARMMESIQNGLDNNKIDDNIRTLLPTRASTIHRLLGLSTRNRSYRQKQLLPLDCVVIDEASMIDLTLMYRLVNALPTDARIILLGDRDQLASVAAGNVLGDITGQGQAIVYSAALKKQLQAVVELPAARQGPQSSTSPVADSIALLTQSFRFDNNTGIGRLAGLVNAGDSAAVIDLLQTPDDQIQWFARSQDQLDKDMLEQTLSNYEAVVKSQNIDQAFAAFERSRVLCAVHSGPFGEVAINLHVDKTMRQRQWIEADANYHGKPILITSNDYELDLFNGDIGILWRDSNQQLRAYFNDGNQGLRSLPTTSLPEYVSAWAMTVHKSQGSEFDTVILMLPPEGQQKAVSRALLYTGITRARQQLLLHADADTIGRACATTSQRHSGLAGRLGWDDLPSETKS